MKESELSMSLKFALFLLGVLSALPLLIGTLILFIALIGLIPYQSKLIDSKTIGLYDYGNYFAYFGFGMVIYFVGRMINFLGTVIKELNLGKFDQNRLVEKLCHLGQEACYITLIIGVSSITLGLIDNIVNSRPFGYYTVLIAWLALVWLSLVANSFLKKLIEESEQ